MTKKTNTREIFCRILHLQYRRATWSRSLQPSYHEKKVICLSIAVIRCYMPASLFLRDVAVSDQTDFQRGIIVAFSCRFGDVASKIYRARKEHGYSHFKNRTAKIVKWHIQSSTVGERQRWQMRTNHCRSSQWPEKKRNRNYLDNCGLNEVLVITVNFIYYQGQ